MRKSRQTIDGMRVHFDPMLPRIADSRGILWWKKIVVGSGFYAFPDRERMAILLHEIGHFRIRTIETRLANLWMLFVFPKRLARLCREQEFSADDYVKERGFARDLAAALTRLPGKNGLLHPSPDERIARLLAPPGK